MYKILVYNDLDFNSNYEVIEFLANKLKEKNYVKEEFVKTILDREKLFPTGIPSEIEIALPHCDNTLVKVPSIAVGILNNSVKFNAMDEPSKELNVKLVIMLALLEPHGHIEMLQKIVKFIQKKNDVEKILSINNIREIKKIIEINL